MKNILLAALTILLSAQAYGNDLSKLAGKYQVNLSGIFSESKIEFLINQNLETKVVKYTGDEALGIPTLDLTAITPASEYGPVAVPVVMISFVEGSDEETHTYQFLVTVERDGQDYAAKLLGTYYSVNDGPNSFANFEATSSTLLKWNKTTKKFQPLAGL